MLRVHLIPVVIPAFNEADKIAGTIRSVPGFVDHVIVVDDGSRDAPAAVAQRAGRRAEATAVMAGDGQMDPADLPRLLAPVVDGAADYAKGNRFAWPGGWRQMPAVRLAGSVALSWLTRAASGDWRLFGSPCGLTAASRGA